MQPNYIFSPLFNVIDHNSSVFCNFIIKLYQKADGTTIMVPGCGHITMTKLVGVRKKTYDLVALGHILYLA